MGAQLDEVEREISVGDLVAVFGRTLSTEGETKRHTSLARVLYVGMNDIIVREDCVSGRIFNVSKTRCVTILEEGIDPAAGLLIPQIGDLVACMSDRFSKEKTQTGILIEIIDVPARYIMATIIQGDTTETCSFNDLIVLSRNT
ncbi:hypothetical protein CMI47_21875 [Candidatus Pacearchaeota archaeon]|nr:hypothetical protein [Candidatus Pacearchaeota archaeon]|tara:strand:+ start:25 stop:456 length:432 start_codon:yes stop_codon:yes gene_type:complete